MRGRAAVERIFPGTTPLALWLLVTVAAPLISYEFTHLWEQDQDVFTALQWTVPAVPVIAAVSARRWTARTGRRRTERAFVAAATAGTATGVLSLAGNAALYRWIIPLSGDTYGSTAPLANWLDVWTVGLPLCAAGAAVGHLVALKRPPPSTPTRWRYLGGATVAAVGALLAPTIVRLGAEDSTRRPYRDGRYGWLEQVVAPTARAARLNLPAEGRYAILAVGSTPPDPACDITTTERTLPPPTRVTVPPGDYGGDAASYAWIASFTVPRPGTYTITCRIRDNEDTYAVGDIPHIPGAVGALIHWPLAAIRLLGAVPGLLIIISTSIRRRRRAPRRQVDN